MDAAQYMASRARSGDTSPTRGISVRRPPRPPADSKAWLVTFADLVALLLAFFVMLFAMSKVDLRKWQNLTDALADSLDAVREIESAVPNRNLDAEPLILSQGQDLDYLGAVLSRQLAESVATAGGGIRREDERIIVSLPVDAPSDAAMDDALFRLAGVLRRIRNRIELVGYGDATGPVAESGRTWEQALERALTLAEGLRRAGHGGRLVIKGAISDALGEARVDLVVHLDGGEVGQ